MNPQSQTLTKIWCEFAGELDQVLTGHELDYHSGNGLMLYVFPGAVLIQGYLDVSMKELGDWDLARLPPALIGAIQDFWENIARLAWCDGMEPSSFIKAAAAEETQFRRALAADLRNLLNRAPVPAYAQTVSTFLRTAFPNITADIAALLHPRIAAAIAAYYESTHNLISRLCCPDTD
ncbi:MAG: hypothetical protein NTX50_14495 [Candidatus Sumerlaeota bacterium]|nr:hypothetical protein [Candidatus Sumerlaeota bacterium]